MDCGIVKFVELVIFPILQMKNENFKINRNEKYGGDFDIIIDDCGHLSDQQQFSMAYLFPFFETWGNIYY